MWKHRAVALCALSAVGLGAWSQGCAANEHQQETTATTATAGTTSGTGGTGGLDLDGGQDDAPFDPDAACVTAVLEGTAIPLDIVILIDRSGSMSDDDKWYAATDALKAFIDDPESDGIGVGLAFFPFDPDDTTCEYQDYQSLLVPIATLPQNATALFNAINMTTPGGNTPMYGALKGTLLAASAYQDAHPKHKVIVLLASDGLPGSCAIGQNSTAAVATVAAAALGYGVETYVVAISGTDVDGLNEIAAAGGTEAAYDVTADTSQLSAKMAEIRGSAIGCELLLPEPPSGQELDTGLVNVQYIPGKSGDPVVLPQADGIVDCGDGPGWYYEGGTEPTQIVLCPVSCEVVQADSDASLKILLGCTTVPN